MTGPDFLANPAAGRFGSLGMTLGVGGAVQALSAVAGVLTLPVIVGAVGPEHFGVLVVVVSLAPWLTLIDGALYPAMRLLVAEQRGREGGRVRRALLVPAVRLAARIGAGNLVLAAVGVLVLPLAELFGAGGAVGTGELRWAVVAFTLPVVISAPGAVYLGALEGVGRTAVAALIAGIGPLVALPLTVVVALLDGGVVALCAIQGLSVAMPRLCAWAYWWVRPSEDAASPSVGRQRVPPRLVATMVLLSAMVVVQLGLDPVIVSSALGVEAAGAYGLASRVLNGALLPLAVVAPLVAANLADARGVGWDAAGSVALRRLCVRAALLGLVIGALVASVGPWLASLLGAHQVSTPRGLYVAAGLFVLTTFVSTPLYLAFAGPTGLRLSTRLNAALLAVNLGASVTLVRLVGPSGPIWASVLAGMIAVVFWIVVWRRRPTLLAERRELAT